MPCAGSPRVAAHLLEPQDWALQGEDDIIDRSKQLCVFRAAQRMHDDSGSWTLQGIVIGAKSVHRVTRR